jgi:hypothetical protein
MAFPLAGKTKGGQLVVKIVFQITEDGGASPLPEDTSFFPL